MGVINVACRALGELVENRAWVSPSALFYCDTSRMFATPVARQCHTSSASILVPGVQVRAQAVQVNRRKVLSRCTGEMPARWIWSPDWSATLNTIALVWPENRQSSGNVQHQVAVAARS